MFGIDPGALRHIPRSEYRKRRAYYQLWRKSLNKGSEDEEPTGVPGVTRTSYTSPELEGATIIEG